MNREQKEALVETITHWAADRICVDGGGDDECVRGFGCADHWREVLRDAMGLTVIRAPFTAEQVEALNHFQQSGMFHLFTCADSSHGPLIATESGWVCSSCDYTQDWAYSAMITMGLSTAQETAEVGENAVVDAKPGVEPGGAIEGQETAQDGIIEEVGL